MKIICTSFHKFYNVNFFFWVKWGKPNFRLPLNAINGTFLVTYSQWKFHCKLMLIPLHKTPFDIVGEQKYISRRPRLKLRPLICKLCFHAGMTQKAPQRPHETRYKPRPTKTGSLKCAALPLSFKLLETSLWVTWTRLFISVSMLRQSHYSPGIGGYVRNAFGSYGKAVVRLLTHSSANVAKSTPSSVSCCARSKSIRRSHWQVKTRNIKLMKVIKKQPILFLLFDI